MKYFLIILIILAFVIGIFDLKFMLECKKEQKNNMDIWNSVLYN